MSRLSELALVDLVADLELIRSARRRVIEALTSDALVEALIESLHSVLVDPQPEERPEPQARAAPVDEAVREALVTRAPVVPGGHRDAAELSDDELFRRAGMRTVVLE